MGKVIAEVSVVPLGTGDTSLSAFVADLERRIRAEKGLRSQLTAMGTILEGDLDQILRLVREIHEIPFGRGARRVSTRIAIDDRRDRAATLESKVRSVEDKVRNP